MSQRQLDRDTYQEELRWRNGRNASWIVAIVFLALLGAANLILAGVVYNRLGTMLDRLDTLLRLLR